LYQRSVQLWLLVIVFLQVLPETVIEVWKGGEKDELAKVTAAGLKTILASPWYLDYISYGKDWSNYYKEEPLNFNGENICLIYATQFHVKVSSRMRAAHYNNMSLCR